MSDIMLHGILLMPPECWDDSPLDQTQRHNRYVEASQLILELQAERDDAVTWIRVVGEEVESGGDRAQTLAAIRALKTRIDDLCKWMNRRVDVEQYLFNCAGGKRPMPTAKQLFALALFLGTPPEQFKNAPQTLKQALEGAE